jgi:hypothetical protein
MLKTRNLLAVAVILVMMMAVMIPLTAAQPAQQATPTPTTAGPITGTATVAAPGAAVTGTAVVSPTAVGTPGTLPTTGGSDDGSANLGLILLALGALILFGVFGIAMSRRTE